MTDRSAEFLAIAAQAKGIAAREAELDGTLTPLEEAANTVARAWSKSSLGYQANVYYAGFKAPPPGHHFSREWGFEGMFQGTVGEWQTFDAEAVSEYTRNLAGDPDLDNSRATSEAARTEVKALIQRAKSNAARVEPPHDDYLRENLDALQKVDFPSLSLIQGVLMNRTTGQFMIRDMRAAEGGWQVAGHQLVQAQCIFLRSPFMTAKELGEVCERIGNHMTLEESAAEPVALQLGTKVFLGHGGASSEYVKLGVWLTDLGLEWEVFDRKPTAGLSTKERLLEMLDNASIAFLLMTPEDQNAQGEFQARANVIHEVGLFQGRLGFTKAIVLLEEGCAEFSNIIGVGQIRYPKGNVNAAFDEVRQVLVREGIL